MSKNITSEFLTKGEEKLLTAMLDVESVKMAALELGITAHTAYNVIYRMKEKYRKGRGYANTLDAQKRRGGLIKKIFGSKKKRRIEAAIAAEKRQKDFEALDEEDLD